MVILKLLAIVLLANLASAQVQPECGLQTAPLETELKVVGGAPAQEGEWPWHGALLWVSMYICGGVLLTPEWVVTTAHCIYLDTSKYSVVLGTHDLANWPPNWQSQDVSSVYIHPEYDEVNGDFDIALLKLTNPVNITDYVRTVCAPEMEMENLFGEGTECIATGWGAVGDIEDMLQETTFTVQSDGACTDESLPELTDNMLCADGSEDSGVCKGDDGGPLVSRVGELWYLVGLTARTDIDSCGSRPAVFTKMTAFYEWISPIFEGEEPGGSSARLRSSAIVTMTSFILYIILTIK